METSKIESDIHPLIPDAHPKENETLELSKVFMNRESDSSKIPITYACINVIFSPYVPSKAAIQFKYTPFKDFVYELTGYLEYLDGSITEVDFYTQLVNKHKTNPILMEYILNVLRKEPSVVEYI